MIPILLGFIQKPKEPAIFLLDFMLDDAIPLSCVNSSWFQIGCT